MSSSGKIAVVIIALVILLPVTGLKGQVVIIANRNIIAKTIDINTLINLYTMRSNELGSEKVKLLFNNSESEVSNKFLSSLKKNAVELKKIWLRARLTNNGLPPQTVSSDSEMLSKVFESPNTIGFIDLKAVTKDVKILMRLD